ncbi:hypothetical protein ABL78_5980 [Leptomonas seymouri]|uniref:Uncharacterized protein n=1 Tax=Leptomonas seymouri TaxID=5684 RepID=A0A0N1HUC5_LEPSE|nr:hypothetical protein ABL78_5980 [Leptomonas seymouri]|eukprot:KPI84965.1 hypothetical protein ABL78_5980 [Leptomonas seymouri]
MTDVGGRTTKQTYVTEYTTDVDPRTLPDFTSRGVVTGDSGWQENNGGQCPPPQHRHRGPAAGPRPQRRHHHSPAYSASREASVTDSSIDEVSGHRLRKKYTTTTVTTITTTTILLPTMQEAYVFPSTTSRHVEQRSQPCPAITSGESNGRSPQQLSSQQQPLYCTDQLDVGHTPTSTSSDHPRQLQLGSTQHSANDHRLVPKESQYGPDGQSNQTWVFNQHTANEVTEESGGRLPTLEELGITSYFSKDRVSQPQPRQHRMAPYAPSDNRGSSHQQHKQPWIVSETRHEVEGGKRYY